jgi:hypothetical protein
MIIYQIKLPAKQDAEAFSTFMRDEYFPAVHKGATRVGKVMSLQLLQGGTDTGAATHEFLWLVGWSGLSSAEARIDDDAVQKKFKTFAPRVKRLGFYKEIAGWEEEG